MSANKRPTIRRSTLRLARLGSLCAALATNAGCLRLPRTPDIYSEPLRLSVDARLPGLPDDVTNDGSAEPQVSSVQRKAATLRKLARDEVRSGHYPLACALLLQATQVDPSDPRLELERADCLLHVNRRADAVDAALHAIGSIAIAPAVDRSSYTAELRQAYVMLFTLRRFVDLPGNGRCAALKLEPTCSRELYACSHTVGAAAMGRRSVVRITSAARGATAHAALSRLASDEVVTRDRVGRYEEAALTVDSTGGPPAPAGQAPGIELSLSQELARGPERCKVVYADACSGFVGAVCQRRERDGGATSVTVVDRRL